MEKPLALSKRSPKVIHSLVSRNSLGNTARIFSKFTANGASHCLSLTSRPESKRNSPTSSIRSPTIRHRGGERDQAQIRSALHSARRGKHCDQSQYQRPATLRTR